MGAQDLSFFSLISLLIFLLPILYINVRMQLPINRTLILSILRMCLQLGFVGLYLEFLFKLNSPVLNITYLLIMIAIACQSILRSSNLKLTKLFIPVFFSLLIPFMIVLFFFNAIVADINNLFETKYLVPIGGMLLGNCLRSIIIGLNRFYSDIRQNEKTYIYSLSLLNNRFHALKPYLQDAFLSSVTPTIASMSTIGLVALPGMMTGQILGGSAPMVAIKYQIAIMLSIFYTEYFSTFLAIFLSLKISFSDLDTLRTNIFARKPTKL